MGSSFKENLKAILECKDMTVKELSRLTGISDRSIGNYLNSRESMPPADYACRIAEVLDTTVEFLITGKNFKIKDFNLPISDNLLKIILTFPKINEADQDLLTSLAVSLSGK